MRITVWNDYICPWAYLGRQRTGVIEALGNRVDVMGFELHPEISEPRPIRAGGRLDQLFDHIAIEAAAVGHPFAPPSMAVNSRRALELAEIVREREPEAFGAVDGALAAAYFVFDRDISDLDVLASVLDEVGLGDSRHLDALNAGDGTVAVINSMEQARSHGITATPAWLCPNGFVIPGVQPVEQITRWITKIAKLHSDDASSTPDK